MKNFIGIYDNVLNQDECFSIMKYFENNSNKIPGRVINGKGGGESVDILVKDSLDIHCYFSNNDNEIKYLLNGLQKYTKLYREEYDDVDLIDDWSLCDTFNIQRYLPGQGYHQPHCESGGKESNNRVLAWTYYLNTVTDGGQTRFPTYDLNIEAKMGRLVIWPAFFTHVHHGVVSFTQVKYIATGWYIYSPSILNI